MITKEKVEHIAKLAKLQLSEEEKEKYSGELSKVVDYIEELNQIDIGDVEPTAQVSGLLNRLRPDIAHDCPSVDQKLALSSANCGPTGLVKVKKIL